MASIPLATIVAASQTAARTASRRDKVAALALALAAAEPDEIPIVVGLLTGEPRQGRIGVGWASVFHLDVAAAPRASLTARDLDATIDAIGAAKGPGSQSRRAELLGALFARATADEQEFIRRLFVGELRQGALSGLMTDAIARASSVAISTVRRAAMLSGDLGDTARVARSLGVAGLAAVGLHVLRGVQPMLAASSPSVAEALAATGPASIEWKLDGARVQVHRDGPDVRIFTRNLNDVTERLPGVVAMVRGLADECVVLDGEVIGLADDERPSRFQDTMATFGAESGDTAGGLGAWFFDVLHHDGDDLIDAPLHQRRSRLGTIEGLRIVPAVTTDDAAVAAAFAEDALRAGHEGVMVKALDAPYDAGRRGGAWRKVKPVRTLDLVVIAAEWGHGRRQGWLSNLHLGARAADGTFVMVGKTFKGLTDELLAWQTEQLLARRIGEDGIVVHVRPELVVEIALDGVQVSRRYPGGVALRFARVRRYRDDKPATQADPIEAVQALLT